MKRLKLIIILSAIIFTLAHIQVFAYNLLLNRDLCVAGYPTYLTNTTYCTPKATSLCDVGFDDYCGCKKAKAYERTCRSFITEMENR